MGQWLRGRAFASHARGRGFESHLVHTMANQNHKFLHYLFTAFYNLVKNLIGIAIWLTVGATGYLIFQTRKTPFDLIIGLPLTLIGAGFVVHSLWTIILTIFSSVYNKAICLIRNSHK